MSKKLTSGILQNNPVLVQLLGMCPTMAVSTSVINAIGMGLSAMAVLVCSNVLISLLRKIIPGKVRIAAYVVIIATFVTMVEMLLKAFFPDISNALGVFIPLIVVNCIILARAEAFASKNSVFDSALDGIGMGLGFTFALLVLGVFRELFGYGTLMGFPIIPDGYPALLLVLPPGGFLCLGTFIAVVQHMSNKKKTREQEGVE